MCVLGMSLGAPASCSPPTHRRSPRRCHQRLSHPPPRQDQGSTGRLVSDICIAPQAQSTYDGSGTFLRDLPDGLGRRALVIGYISKVASEEHLRRLMHVVFGLLQCRAGLGGGRALDT